MGFYMAFEEIYVGNMSGIPGKGVPYAISADLSSPLYATKEEAEAHMTTDLGNMTVGKRSVGNTGDNYGVYVVPERFYTWAGKQVHIAYSGDGPVFVSSGVFNGAYGVPTGGGNYHRTYAKLSAPEEGAFSFANKLGTGDTSSILYAAEYEHGIFIQCAIDTGAFNCVITDYGEMRICITDRAGATFPVYGMLENSRALVTNIELDKGRIYTVVEFTRLIRGTVFDAAGEPAPGRKVFLYDRLTGVLLGSAVSGTGGAYDVISRSPSGTQAFMVCLDDDPAPDFDPVVVDRITIV